MERNQFYNVSNQIIKIERETKKKSAYIQIAIPDDVCEKIINSILAIKTNKESAITGMELSWYDKTLE